MDIKPWLDLADRVRKNNGYTHADLARDLARQLTWRGAVDVATAIRAHVYGQPGGHPLHQDVKPLYDRLGWEQAALLAAWFRDSRNWPNSQPKKRVGGRLPGGWPTAALPTTRTADTKEAP